MGRGFVSRRNQARGASDRARSPILAGRPNRGESYSESSKRIGLIPNIATEKILQVGNASIEGASIALLSRTKRAELEALVKRVTHCRLETHPGFFNYFVEGCQFNPIESAARVDS